jgi:23S rRNA (guanine1835-N2)-methyltransferase
MVVTRYAERLSLRAQVSTDRDTYRFRTADGLHSDSEFRPAELRLLDALWEQSLGTLLVVQANYGVLGTILDAVATSVTMTDTSARATRLTRENTSINGTSATVSLCASPIELDSSFETACYAPKPYTPLEVGTQHIVDTLSVLEPGGTLYIAGSPSGGLNRYEACLRDNCASVEQVHSDGSVRVIAGTHPAAFDPVTYVNSTQLRTTVDGTTLTMQTKPGLFSATELDQGTRLLIETVTIEDGERVLDLACGYGPVGGYAASVADCSVVLTDDCARATACARRTLDATGVDAQVVTADCARSVEGQFDRILSNPPTHAGDGVLSEMFANAADLLADGGTLSVVHHSALTLDGHLSTVGSITERTSGSEHTVVTVERR